MSATGMSATAESNTGELSTCATSSAGTYGVLDWRKASASGNNGCLEVAPLPDGGVAVRDSKDPAGPVLSFTRHEWVSFLDGVSRGEFDRLA